MDKLYVKTKKGDIPIEQGQVEKYHLTAGTLSPNNRYDIVDQTKEVKPKPQKTKADYNMEEVTSDGLRFQTSEILDIALGADSRND